MRIHFFGLFAISECSAVSKEEEEEEEEERENPIRLNA